MPRMAYIPPEGDALVLANSCYLIWLPDDPVYRAAFWGRYSDLAEPWLWDESDPDRQDDIRASWLEAVHNTLESLDMACLESLTAKMDEVLQAINAARCCGDTIFVSDSFNTLIVPGQGDPPATWGDGETVADWADWEELVCGPAQDFVDRLEAVAITFRELLLAGNLTIGTVADAFRFSGWLGLLFSVASSVAASVYHLIFEGGASLFDGLADDIETERDNIVCAILLGGDLAAAVQTAVGSLAWAAFYSFIDYDSVKALIYEGGGDGQFLGVNRSETCTGCDFPFDWNAELVVGDNWDAITDFANTTDRCEYDTNWTGQGGSVVAIRMSPSTSEMAYMAATTTQIASFVSGGPTSSQLFVTRIEVDILAGSVWAAQGGTFYVQVRLLNAGLVSYGPYTTSQTVILTFDGSDNLTSPTGDYAVRLRGAPLSSGGTLETDDVAVTRIRILGMSAAQ